MFSELIKRNSKRNWKDNILYAVSMILAIVAFYIILSLDRQDVMVFLKEMERVAVNKLLALIPVVYVVSLFLLYFLIYFTDKYQVERRSHEFGTYLMLGMKKRNLFQMLFLEDLRNSGYALLIGIPCALLLSEIISLVTARAAGFGILRHQFTLSVPALICTVVGFLSIKLLARLVLCAKLWKKEVYDLLYEAKPERQKTFSPEKIVRESGFGSSFSGGGIWNRVWYFKSAIENLDIVRDEWTVMFFGNSGDFLSFSGIGICI